jgi:hypothetical protein
MLSAPAPPLMTLSPSLPLMMLLNSLPDGQRERNYRSLHNGLSLD